MCIRDRLRPGGVHLMLIGLNVPLVAGETAPLTLRFDNAPEITVQARIRQPSAHDMAH